MKNRRIEDKDNVTAELFCNMNLKYVFKGMEIQKLPADERKQVALELLEDYATVTQQQAAYYQRMSALAQKFMVDLHYSDDLTLEERQLLSIIYEFIICENEGSAT